MLPHFFAVDPQMPLLSKSNLVPSTQHWPECPAWYAEMQRQGSKLQSSLRGLLVALSLQLRWRLLSAKRLPTELQRGQAASKTFLLDGSWLTPTRFRNTKFELTEACCGTPHGMLA